jgi:hypothetical protein
MTDAANTEPEVGDELGNGEAETPAEPELDAAEMDPLDTYNPEDYPIEERVANLEDGMTSIIGHLADQSNILQNLVDAATEAAKPAPAEPPVGVPDPSKYFKPLPEGTHRFRSVQFTDLVLIRDPGYHEVINGRAIFVNPKQVQFQNGIADVKDPELVAWMQEHPELGRAFIEDPYAVPASQGPAIQEGGRGAGKTPRDPQPARRGALEASL